MWIGYSEFELRNSEDGLAKARKILGRAIGQTSINKPKIKIFKYYIDLEKMLGDWNRVRLLFQKWLEVSLLTTSLSELVIERYVEFESSIEEYDRCDLILSSARQLSENPEYSSSFNLQRLLEITVEFYKEEMQYDKIREIYRALLDKDPNAHNGFLLPYLNQYTLNQNNWKNTYKVIMKNLKPQWTSCKLRAQEIYLKKL